MTILLLLTILVLLYLHRKTSLQWKEGVQRLQEIAQQLAQSHRPKSFLRSGPPSLIQISNQLEKVSELQSRLHQQLHQEEYSQRAILKGMIEGVMIVDHHKEIRLANEACTQLFGLTIDPVGKSIIAATQRFELDRLVQKTFLEASAQTIELTLPSPQNPHLSTHLSINAFPFPLESSGKSGVVLVIHNISQIKRLEEIRKEFVGNVSHELKTPLAIFQGYVETLLDNPQLEPPEQKRIYQTLLRHSHRLNALVEDLLSLARLESRRLPLQFESVNIISHLEIMMEDWKKRLLSKNIQLHLQTSETPFHAEIDLLRFEQVINNLMDNALKYSKEKSTLQVSVHKNSTHFTLKIKDEGIGISATDLPHIFERFYRVDKARSRELGGTGLGLSIVKHIILLHQGEVHAESEEGKGTSITVELPLSQNILG